MVKVECDGCKAPYQIDEKRIPPTGLKMRCPKCGTNILVTKPAQSGQDQQDLPAVAPTKASSGGAPPRPPPPRPPPKGPPPVPKAAAAQSMDIEPDSDRPLTRSGFGEIDLMVDLPAPGDQPAAGFSAPGYEDLPALPADLPALRAVAPPRPPAPRGAPPPTPPPFGFGEIDLPAPHPGPAAPFGVVDLPAVPGSFGEIDLPVAHSAHSARPAPPPTPPPPRARGRTVNFGDIDLPAVPDGLDLPEPVGERGFGEIDLPLVADDFSPGVGLPMAAPGAGLPAYAQGGGLPMAAPGVGLPAYVQGGGLPMAAPGAGLPAYAQGGGLPMPAQGGGLPAYVQGGGLPALAQGGGLPMAAPGGGLPMAAIGTGFPMPASGEGLPSAVAGGGVPMAVGDELSLGDAGSRSSAFDDSDRAVPGQLTAAPLGSVGIDLVAPTRAVGDEADLSNAGAGEPGAPSQQRRAPREVVAAPRRGNARKVVIGAAVLFMVTGAALSLVPAIGPFGFNFVSDQINAKGHGAALDELKKSAAAALDEDTTVAVAGALERCRALSRTMPRFAPTKAYCAYLAVERGLRFGRRNEDEAFARQLLKDGGEDGSGYAQLAQAGLDALGGQAAKAKPTAAAVAGRAPSDLDAAVTLGGIELAARSGAPAVEAWKRAVGLKKSARTLHGLARAQAAIDKTDEAVEAGRGALAASPKHDGARILVASLIWRGGKEDEAVTLLKQVTDQGKSAGDAELIESYTLLGRIHLSKSRISAAEQAFASALKLDPLAVPALVGNAELFYRSGRFSEALSRFENATKADADSVLGKVGYAKTLIALERMKEAKDLMKKLRETHPTDPLVRLWAGRADEALGNKKEAEAAYIEAIKLGENKPEVVDAYVALAHLLSGVGRNDDANARLAEASKKFPASPALHRARGEVALQLGRYEEAKTEFEAALGKEEDLGARFRLGVALRRMRKFEEAGLIFDKVSEVDRDYPGLALERGLLFQETGQSDKALEAYRLALQKAPNDVDLKLRVGSTQVIAGQPKEAIKILEEVRKERHNSAEANHFLGRALLLRGTNLAEAMRYLERAVAIDSNRAEYQLYVGWAANELNNTSKAQAALNKALELDRELGDAYWQRGVMLQKLGANDDALKDLQTALEKRPSRYEAWATVALCYQDKGRWADAEQAWRRAIGGGESKADWHFRLGKLLGAHGGGTKAVPELEKAIELATAPDAIAPAWVAEAHFLLAEGLKTAPASKAQAIEHYKKFIELAPRDNAYVVEAQKALTGLGVRLQ